MNVNTKTVTMMDLRHNIGAIIDEMLYQNKKIILKRKNKTLGILNLQTEQTAETVKTMDDTAARNQKIDKLYGCMSYLTKQEVEDWIHTGDETAADKAHDEYLKSLWQKQ